MRYIQIIVTFMLSMVIISFIASCKRESETTSEQNISLGASSPESYLLKYSVDDSIFVTQHVTDRSKLHLARGEWEKS